MEIKNKKIKYTEVIEYGRVIKKTGTAIFMGADDRTKTLVLINGTDVIEIPVSKIFICRNKTDKKEIVILCKTIQESINLFIEEYQVDPDYVSEILPNSI